MLNPCCIQNKGNTYAGRSGKSTEVILLALTDYPVQSFWMLVDSASCAAVLQFLKHSIHLRVSLKRQFNLNLCFSILKFLIVSYKQRFLHGNLCKETYITGWCSRSPVVLKHLVICGFTVSNTLVLVTTLLSFVQHLQ